MTRPVTFVPDGPKSTMTGFVTDAFNATTIVLVAVLGLLTVVTTL